MLIMLAIAATAILLLGYAAGIVTARTWDDR